MISKLAQRRLVFEGLGCCSDKTYEALGGTGWHSLPKSARRSWCCGAVGLQRRAGRHLESLLSVDCPGLYCFLLADSCKAELSLFRWKSNLDPYSSHVVTRNSNLLFVFAATHYFASLANRSALRRNRLSTSCALCRSTNYAVDR